MNVEFLIKVYIHNFYTIMIVIWRNCKIKVSILKTEGLVKKQIAYVKHIKIQCFHMDVIFMPKHLIWKRSQCVYILVMIMHCQPENVFCDSAINIHGSILLTKKQIISIHTQLPQYGFTYITSLRVVLLIVEFHWNTRKYAACVNRYLHQKIYKNIH